jgi:hypothetical protein
VELIDNSLNSTEVYTGQVKISPNLNAHTLNYYLVFVPTLWWQVFRRRRIRSKSPRAQSGALKDGFSNQDDFLSTRTAADALQLYAPIFSPMDRILGCSCVLSYARHLKPET